MLRQRHGAGGGVRLRSGAELHGAEAEPRIRCDVGSDAILVGSCILCMHPSKRDGKRGGGNETNNKEEHGVRRAGCQRGMVTARWVE
eukprot:365986-Chlamydomonas_euryale.AAC.14